MLKILFFSFLAVSTDNNVTICLCKKCLSYTEGCKGQIHLDPESRSFYEDFSSARRNRKDIKIIINEESDVYNIELDLNALIGQNIIYNSPFPDKKINLNLLYTNQYDYSATRMSFPSNILPIFRNKKPELLINQITIGSLKTENSKVIFCKLEGSTLVLKYKSLKINLDSLTNITSLEQLEAGETDIKLGSIDKLQVSFSTSGSSFVYNEKNIVFSYVQDSSLIIVGALFNEQIFNDELTIDIQNAFKTKNLPKLNLNCVSNLRISGMFDPFEAGATYVHTIENCSAIEIPKGDFPFNVKTIVTTMKVSGDTNIYGNITSDNLMIISDIYSQISLVINEIVDAKILIKSDYVNIEINKFSPIPNRYTNKEFPIELAFGFDRFSRLTIDKFVSNYTFDVIKIYGTSVNTVTDKQIDEKYKNGIELIKIKNGKVLTADTLQLSIDSTSPSSVAGNPGFSSFNNCFGIELTNLNSFVVKKIKSAYMVTRYICFTQSSKCKMPSEMTEYSYAEFDITSDDFSINKAIPVGFKSVYMCSTQSSSHYLDFDLLTDPSYEDMIVTFTGTSYTKMHFKNTNPTKINSFSVSGIKLSNNIEAGFTYEFLMPNLNMKKVSFESKNQYKFSDNTILTIDYDSQDSLMSMNDKIGCNSTIIYIDTDSSAAITISMFNDHWEFGQSSSCSIPYTVKNLTFDSKNMLNIDMQITPPEQGFIDIPGCKIIKEFNKKVTLKNKNWEKANFVSEIVIDHGEDSFDLIITQPYQMKNISFAGSGSVSINVKYDESDSVCLKNLDEAKSCKNDYDIVINNTESISPKLSELDLLELDIYADKTVDPIPIDFSLFDSRFITLNTYQSGSIDTFQLVFDSTEVSQYYSKIELNNAKLDVKETPDNPIKFGRFVMSDKAEISDKWTQEISMNVGILQCSYLDLFKFKEITIYDQLILTGSQQTEQTKTIKFDKKTDSPSLVAEITSDVLIKITKQFVQIANICYGIKQTDKFDIELDCNEDSTITVECDSDVLLQEIPRIKINIYSNVVPISFTGTWPDTSSLNRELILLECEDASDITISGQIPLSIIGAYSTKIHLEGNSCSILGPLEYNNDMFSKDYPIHIISSIEGDISFSIPQGIVIESGKMGNVFDFIDIQSENITMTIGKIINKVTNPKSIQLNISETIGIARSSSLVVLEKIDQSVSFCDTLTIRSTITGSFDKEEDIKYLNKGHLILKFQSDEGNYDNLSFKYLVDDTVTGRTHGFYQTMNCLALKSTKSIDNNYEWKLNNFKMPSEIPFTIYFAPPDAEDAELVISKYEQNKFSELSSIMPKYIKIININLFKDMDTTSNPLNLNQFPTGTNISIYSNNNSPCVVYLGIPTSNQDLNIVFSNLKFTTIAANSNQLSAKSLNFTRCAFANELFRIGTVQSLVVDPSSLTNLVSNSIIFSFSNPLLVQSANIIIFNNIGWDIKESTVQDSTLIDPTKFTQMSFETTRNLVLRIEKGTSSIKGLTINAIPQEEGILDVLFSRYWKDITVQGNLLIKTNGAKAVNIISPAYPIPNIFDCDQSILNYKFDIDDFGNFDKIVLESSFRMNNKDLIFDLTPLSKENQVVVGNMLEFNGKCSFTFVDGIGKIEAKEVMIKGNSEVVLSSIDSIFIDAEINSILTSDFEFQNESVIKYRWNLEGAPMINIRSSIQGTPKFILDYQDSTIDIEKYNNKLFNGPGMTIMKSPLNCKNLIKNDNYQFNSQVHNFNSGSSNVLDLKCEYINDEYQLVIKGVKMINYDDDSDQGSKSSPLSTGSIIGIVIGCAVALALIVGIIIYKTQKKKYEDLKREILISGKTGSYIEDVNEEVAP